jgi:NAD-dependent deacetylase
MASGSGLSVEEVARRIVAADQVTVLTGAGISTDSGIPDFRGPNGVWTKDPAAERMFTYDAYVSDPQIRRRSWIARRDNAAWAARPNAGHAALVDLERTGRLRAIVTQNIDGLHQAAGSDPHRVIEVHGTMFAVACLSCSERTTMADAVERVRSGEEDPSCQACGGILKSATISFGQPLDELTLLRAHSAAVECDVFLAVGTSLQVYPVAGLVEIARRARALTVIVNAEPTPYDSVVDSVIQQPISAVLPRLVADAAAA